MTTAIVILIVFTLLILVQKIDPKREWWVHKEHQYKEEFGDSISLQTIDVYVNGVYSHTEEGTGLKKATIIR